MWFCVWLVVGSTAWEESASRPVARCRDTGTPYPRDARDSEQGQPRMALKECLKLSWARVCGGWYRAKLKRGFAGIAFPFARGFWSTHAYFRLPCADGETVPG